MIRGIEGPREVYQIIKYTDKGNALNTFRLLFYLPLKLLSKRGLYNLQCQEMGRILLAIIQQHVVMDYWVEII